MSNHVLRTWADGFGTWHAACAPKADLRVLQKQARRAILAELALREGPNFSPASVRVVYDGSGNGQMFFVETEPNEPTSSEEGR